MAVGAVLMLFVAAILEGGFRQLDRQHAVALRDRIRRPARLWLAYFSLAGEQGAADEP